MDSAAERLERLEHSIGELAHDLRVLRRLVEQDVAAALNKVRYVTEKVLFGMCRAHELSWGDAEPTLERMIGPLRKNGVVPKDMMPYVRSIQAFTSPGSHFQEKPLSVSHVSMAQAALIEFLEWFYSSENAPIATDKPSRPSAPFMAPALPPGFVRRGGPLAAVRESLLIGRPVVTLYGAGGFGKSTLASAVCHDPAIREAFPDGVLWTTLGQNPDVVFALGALENALTQKRVRFANLGEAEQAIAAVLDDRRCLVVIDDVWHGSHLTPFLAGGDDCARLVTTRDFQIAAAWTRIAVDEMTPGEAATMLTSRLDGAPSDAAAPRRLARRLGEWPLLLELAGAAIHRRVLRGDSVDDALAYVARTLDRRGATAFDLRRPQTRNEAVSRSIATSTDMLSDNERSRFVQLSIFPEDIAIPIGVVALLWDTDEVEAEETLETLADLSLLKLSLGEGTIQMHDVVRELVTSEVGDAGPFHEALVDGWGDRHTLSGEYAWRWYCYHLAHAGRHDELRRNLIDFEWLRAKLEATQDIRSIIAEYDLVPQDPGLDEIRDALRLGARAISRGVDQLAGQIVGRLSFSDRPEARELVVAARRWRGARWLCPEGRSLEQPGGRLVSSLGGHRRPVTAFAITPDDAHVVSGSGDHAVKLWDLRSGSAVLSMMSHKAWVSAIAVTPDGRGLSGAEDGSLLLWDLDDGRVLSTLVGHEDTVTAIVVSPTGAWAATASLDRTIRIWDLEKGVSIGVLRGHEDAVQCLTLAGRFLVSGSIDTTVRIWDAVATESRPQVLREHRGWVRAVAAAGDERVVSVSDDGTARVWALQDGRQEVVLEAHGEAVRCVAVQASGRVAVSGAVNGSICVWRTEDGALLQRLQPNEAPISSVAISPDDSLAATTSYDMTARLWNLDSGACWGVLRGHSNWVRSSAFTRSGELLVTSSMDHTMKVWRVDVEEADNALDGHDAPISCLAANATRELIATGGQDGRAMMWNARDLEVSAFRESASSAIVDVAVDGRGSRVVSGSTLGELNVWRSADGSLERQLDGEGDWINAVAVDHDGEWVAAGARSGMIRVWDLDSGERRFALSGHQRAVLALTVSRDGSTLVSGGHDGRVRVWDARTGDLRHVFDTHRAPVSAVWVSGSGDLGISASYDHSVRIWDLVSGAEVALLAGHTSAVLDVAATDDLEIVVSGSKEGAVIVWDEQRQHRAYAGHSDTVQAVDVSPGGRWVVSVSNDMTVRTWPAGNVHEHVSGKWGARFHGEHAMYCVRFADEDLIVAGDAAGRVHWLRLVGPEDEV